VKTVICQIRNEAMLLPLWLKHHLPLFDYGVFIDFKSTDGTREIIRDLAHHWRIVDSVNPMFDARDIDMQVMAVEGMVDGWKCSLNVTEFLLPSPDFWIYLEWVERNTDAQGIVLSGVTLCDMERTRSDTLDYSVPFLRQRHHGFFSCGPHMYPLNSRWGQRDRIMHRMDNGKYKLGRHGCHLGIMTNAYDKCYVSWAGFSPFDQQKARKLAIRANLSDTDMLDNTRSPQHKVNTEELEQMFCARTEDVIDLFIHEHYRRNVSLLPMSYT
jgi:hypothetical protein